MSDVTLEGTLHLDDFGGSVITLQTADGQRWQLQGIKPGDLPADPARRVRVQGARAAAQFGFAMVGPILEVRRIDPVA